MLKQVGLVASLSMIMMAAGCATTPKTPEQRQTLERNAQATLETMQQQDPFLSEQLEGAHAYVVFPRIGKGGALVGGAWGRGVVYQQGEQIGFAELNQASLGAQLGAQTFAELILFENQQALENFKAGGLEVGTSASVVFLRRGAANQLQFGDQGTAIVLMPREGAMVDLSVTGQEIDYQPTGM